MILRVVDGFAQLCPRRWANVPDYAGHSCPSSRSSVLNVLVIRTRVHGYGYSCTRVRVTMYVVKIFIGVRLLIVNLFYIPVEPHVGVTMLLAPFQHVLLLFRHESCLS